jgi:hypothetical protein
MLFSVKAGRVVGQETSPRRAVDEHHVCAHSQSGTNPIPRDEMPRGSSIEPDLARKWDPVTLKAADGRERCRQGTPKALFFNRERKDVAVPRTDSGLRQNGPNFRLFWVRANLESSDL